MLNSNKRPLFYDLALYIHADAALDASQPMEVCHVEIEYAASHYLHNDTAINSSQPVDVCYIELE